MDTLRVLIVDDHPLFRRGLGTLVDATADLEVVGEASSGAEAMAAAASLRPDVVVMDLNMPGLNGIEATRAILRTDTNIRILVLTIFDDDDSVFAAMRAGAHGYVLKDAEQGEIIRAILAVGHGEVIFGPAVAEQVMRLFSVPRHVEPPPDAFPELSGREREILQLIAGGESNPAIARKLVLSPKTVRNHVSNIFSKLQAADRAETIIRAREAGFGGDT